MSRFSNKQVSTEHHISADCVGIILHALLDKIANGRIWILYATDERFREMLVLEIVCLCNDIGHGYRDRWSKEREE